MYEVPNNPRRRFNPLSIPLFIALPLAVPAFSGYGDVFWLEKYQCGLGFELQYWPVYLLLALNAGLPCGILWMTWREYQAKKTYGADLVIHLLLVFDLVWLVWCLDNASMRGVCR